jgi:hypothetical protein
VESWITIERSQFYEPQMRVEPEVPAGDFEYEHVLPDLEVGIKNPLPLFVSFFPNISPTAITAKVVSTTTLSPSDDPLGSTSY